MYDHSALASDTEQHIEPFQDKCDHAYLGKGTYNLHKDMYEQSTSASDTQQHIQPFMEKSDHAEQGRGTYNLHKYMYDHSTLLVTLNNIYSLLWNTNWLDNNTYSQLLYTVEWTKTSMRCHQTPLHYTTGHTEHHWIQEHIKENYNLARSVQQGICNTWDF